MKSSFKTLIVHHCTSQFYFIKVGFYVYTLHRHVIVVQADVSRGNINTNLDSLCQSLCFCKVVCSIYDLKCSEIDNALIYGYAKSCFHQFI